MRAKGAARGDGGSGQQEGMEKRLLLWRGQGPLQGQPILESLWIATRAVAGNLWRSKLEVQDLWQAEGEKLPCSTSPGQWWRCSGDWAIAMAVGSRTQ